jgi:hypothetical protein
MKKTDKILSDLFKKNMHKIEDESFTEKIINMHLLKQKWPVSKPFPNFGLLIIGISSVIISFGLILSLKIKIAIFDGFTFTELHGLILLLISLIFLFYTWIDSFITPKKKVTGNL